MVTETERAVMEIINRIKLLEDEARRNANTPAAKAILLCKWVAQDVLEEISKGNGYF